MIDAVLPVYKRNDIVFSHGQGCRLYDAGGKEYLDFGTGYATNSLGHCHPKLVAALEAQAHKLWHCGNTFRIAGQEALAQRLVELTFADSVFFVNSGSEAVELALKMARKYFYVQGQAQRQEIITFAGAFHGRTYGAISASGGDKMVKGFAPLVDGFVQMPFGDLDAVKAAVSDKTAAIFLEPIQGEGGVRMPPAGFLQGLRDLCDAEGILLAFDEVQTGNGRSGELYAHQALGATPDIMCTAKGLGGGFPIGATLATEPVAAAMTVGSHGSTFGGNPLAMAVGQAVLSELTADGFLAGVRQKAAYLQGLLEGLVQEYPDIFAGVRCLGLMQGLRCQDGVDSDELRRAFLAAGLLTMPAGDNVLRLLPPLIVETSDMDAALEIMHTVLKAR